MKEREGKTNLIPFRTENKDIRIQEVQEELNLDEVYPTKKLDSFENIEEEKMKNEGQPQKVVENI